MPKVLEDKLKREYPGNDRAVSGTLNALGAMRGSKDTARGRSMQKAHEAHGKRNNLGTYLHPKKAR